MRSSGAGADSRGRRFLWVPASRLSDAAIQLSPTMQAVRPTLLGVIPRRRSTPLFRQSEGGIALFQRAVRGKRQWLAQWNENWQAFFFVGGHRQESETFSPVRHSRDRGRTGPGRVGLHGRVASGGPPRIPCSFPQRRRADGLRDGAVRGQARAGRSRSRRRDSRNRWLTEGEIRGLEAHDGRPISVTILLLLNWRDGSRIVGNENSWNAASTLIQ